jgi:glycerol-3-phosphate acyltransferase PlsY
LAQLLTLVALVVGSYAFGCVVGAYYLVRWRTGRDLRAEGSGNAGARNASRILGATGFAVVLLIDAGKGALATWIGLQLSPQPAATILAMAAVVAGHIWPLQLRFRGGKGAATALGIILVFDPVVMLVIFLGGLIVLAAARNFTIAGLVAIALSPAAAAWRGHGPEEVIALAIIAASIVYAHRTNLSEYRTRIGKPSPTRHQESAR